MLRKKKLRQHLRVVTLRLALSLAALRQAALRMAARLKLPLGWSWKMLLGWSLKMPLGVELKSPESAQCLDVGIHKVGGVASSHRSVQASTSEVSACLHGSNLDSSLEVSSRALCTPLEFVEVQSGHLQDMAPRSSQWVVSPWMFLKCRR